MLLAECNLHTILDMPQGTFQGAGVRTVVLFFEKGSPTTRTWFYQLDPGRNLGKTNPLNDSDMAEFVTTALTKPTTSRSWTIQKSDLDSETLDLTVRNPNEPSAAALRTPFEILEDIDRIDGQVRGIIDELREMLR